MLQPSDSSWVASRMYESVNILEAEQLRPCMLVEPRLYPDGDMWCALYGENIQEGVCGFGVSPDSAMKEFDKSWYKEEKNEPI